MGETEVLKKILGVLCFCFVLGAGASEKLKVVNLGAYSLTPLPSPHSWGSMTFGERKLQSSKDTWHLRGKWAIGGPVQSFVDSVEVGSDQYLVSTLGGGLQLMEISSLNSRWTFKVRAGVGSKPLVVGNSVVVAGMDSFIYKLNLGNGKQEWKAKVSSESFGGIAASMGVLYVNTNDNMLWALDEKTGNVLWTYKRPGNEKPMLWSLRGQSVPKVSLDGRYIYLGFSDGYFVCLESSSGTTLWERSFEKRGMFDDADTTPVLSRDGKSVFVSIVDGDLLALNALTGVTLWAAPGGGSAYPPLYRAEEGALYVGGVTSFQKLDAKNGALLWSYPLVSIGLAATPVIVKNKGVVFAASHFGLVMLSVDSGKLIWQQPYAAGLSAQLSGDGERFWLLSGRNRIHLFRAVDSKEPKSLKKIAKIRATLTQGARRNLASPL